MPTFVDRPEGLAPILAHLSKFLQAPAISLVMYLLCEMWSSSGSMRDPSAESFLAKGMKEP